MLTKDPRPKPESLLRYEGPAVWCGRKKFEIARDNGSVRLLTSDLREIVQICYMIGYNAKTEDVRNRVFSMLASFDVEKNDLPAELAPPPSPYAWAIKLGLCVGIITLGAVITGWTITGAWYWLTQS